jgi:lipid-binding SYLF domain-containing protein
MRRRLTIGIIAGALALGASETADRRLASAATAFQEIMGADDKAIPQKLLDKAECVVVAPSVKSAAFLVGGKWGKGFVLCRGENGVGWSAPGAIRMEGGSFGFQAGGSGTDIFMLVMNKGGAEKLIKSSKFTLGGEMAAAAGPVGRNSTAQTDALMNAQILSYSRSRGVFAGVSLNAGTLRQDLDANREMYGKTIENFEVVLERKVEPDAEGKKLIELLNKYSSRKTG